MTPNPPPSAATRYALRAATPSPEMVDPAFQRPPPSSVASSRSRSSSLQSSTVAPPDPTTSTAYRPNQPQPLLQHQPPYIPRTVSGVSSITSNPPSEYDSCVYSASTGELDSNDMLLGINPQHHQFNNNNNNNSNNINIMDPRNTGVNPRVTFQAHPQPTGAGPQTIPSSYDYEYTHTDQHVPAYPPPAPPTSVLRPPSFSGDYNDNNNNNALRRSYPPRSPATTTGYSNNIHNVIKQPVSSASPPAYNSNNHHHHSNHKPMTSTALTSPPNVSPIVTVVSPDFSPTDFRDASYNHDHDDSIGLNDHYFNASPGSSSPNVNNIQSNLLPQSFLDTPPSFSTSGLMMMNDTDPSSTGNDDMIDNHNNNSPAMMQSVQNRHRHEDDSWRSHGRTYRAKLIQHDEQNGRHDFEMSHDCSIKRYHLVAEKVLAQFLDTRDDPHVNLRDTYLVGMRLSKFLSTVLPTHKDFNSTDPELSELRRMCNERWLHLNHYLEELALIIDEEEHNQFVLRDLNDTLDGGEDNNLPDVPTGEVSALASLTESPPSLIIASPKKKNRSSPRSSPNNQHSSNTNSININQSIMAHEGGPDLVNQSGDSRSNRAILMEDANNASTNAIRMGHHHSMGAVASSSKANTNRNLGSEINAVADNPGGGGGDPWKLPGDTATVASLETHWFSTAGFSDPFPPTEDNNNNNAHAGDPISDFNEHEQIVQISGSNNSRRPRPDHQDVDFAGLSLEEEGHMVDYFATGHMAKMKEAIAIKNRSTALEGNESKEASPKDGSSKPNWRIAPFPSSKTTRQEGPLGIEALKEKYGTLPFRGTTKGQPSMASTEKRVSFMEPEKDEVRATPSQANATEEMSSWWDSPRENSSEGASATEKPGSQQMDESQHSKFKAATRMSSRYMALDEHEARQKQVGRRRQIAPANVKAAPNGSPEQEDPWDQSELRPIRRDEDSDADFAQISAVLDGNKARARDMKPYRHRGMHHLKECVRCLLE